MGTQSTSFQVGGSKGSICLEQVDLILTTQQQICFQKTGSICCMTYLSSPISDDMISTGVFICTDDKGIGCGYQVVKCAKSAEEIHREIFEEACARGEVQVSINGNLD